MVIEENVASKMIEHFAIGWDLFRTAISGTWMYLTWIHRQFHYLQYLKQNTDEEKIKEEAKERFDSVTTILLD